MKKTWRVDPFSLSSNKSSPRCFFLRLTTRQLLYRLLVTKEGTHETQKKTKTSPKNKQRAHPLCCASFPPYGQTQAHTKKSNTPPSLPADSCPALTLVGPLFPLHGDGGFLIRRHVRGFDLQVVTRAERGTAAGKILRTVTIRTCTHHHITTC